MIIIIITITGYTMKIISRSYQNGLNPLNASVAIDFSNGTWKHLRGNIWGYICIQCLKYRSQRGLCCPEQHCLLHFSSPTERHPWQTSMSSSMHVTGCLPCFHVSKLIGLRQRNKEMRKKLRVGRLTKLGKKQRKGRNKVGMKTKDTHVCWGYGTHETMD